MSNIGNFLEELNNSVKDRYSENDSKYLEYIEKKTSPPIIKITIRNNTFIFKAIILN